MVGVSENTTVPNAIEPAACVCAFIAGSSPGGMVEVCSVVQASNHTVHNNQGIINSTYSASTQNCCKSHKHDAENLFLVTRYC
jgi:hypothetical protein